MYREGYRDRDLMRTLNTWISSVKDIFKIVGSQ